jgi:hypothetical protein
MARDIGVRMGARPFAAQLAMAERRGVMRQISEAWTAEEAIVHDYDAEAGTVDLKLKRYPRGAIFRDIHVYDDGDSLRRHRALKTELRHGIGNATVGMVVFPRTESGNALADRQITASTTKLFHCARGGRFFPGVRIDMDDPLPILSNNGSATDADQIGPDDDAFIHESGSRLIFKSTGDVVLLAAPGRSVFFGVGDQLTGSMAALARVGDAVQVGASSGTITGGSSVVRGG